MTRFRIAHSGITWGYSASTAAWAVRDIAKVGYTAYETIGDIIEAYDAREPETFAGLLARYDLPLAAVYCVARFHNPTHAADVGGGPRADVVRQAVRGHELGATTLVLQAAGRDGRPYEHPRQWEGMAATFNGIASKAAKLGMRTAIHPHTGTLIETRDEIDAIMAAVNPDLVGFAPDTGQIAKAGADMLDTLAAYRDRIWHVHLKDWSGGRETGYAEYEAIGSGVLDIPSTFALLDRANYQGWVTVELDGTPSAQRSPREAAEMSKRYLSNLLGEQALWSHS